MNAELNKARLYRELKAKFDHHKPIMLRAMDELKKAEIKAKKSAA